MDSSSGSAAAPSANNEDTEGGSDLLLATRALVAALEHAVARVSGLERDYKAASSVLRHASDADQLVKTQGIMLCKEMRGSHQRAEAAARLSLINGLRARARGGTSSFELGYLWTGAMTELEVSIAALDSLAAADTAGVECCM